MSLADDFEGLMEDDTDDKSAEKSAKYMQDFKRFMSSNNLTFSGVYRDSIEQCIDVKSTNSIPWEHIILTLDISKLRDISKPRISQFTIPDFVEELQCVGEGNHSGFGFNEYGRNHIKNVMIPSSVYVISKATFKMFRKLESVLVQENSRLSIISDEAFAYCEHLIEIDLSNCKKLTTIGKSVFTGSSTKVLKINSNIRKFDTDTFKDCNIQTIYINDRKYKFSDFIDMLKDNGFNAFWI